MHEQPDPVLYRMPCSGHQLVRVYIDADNASLPSQAFVGYRDIEDKYEFSICEFEDDADEFSCFLSCVTARGNGRDNRCEDVAGGLQVQPVMVSFF